MLTVEQALDRCLAASLPLRTERIAAAAASGRVLAADIVAPAPLPPWDNSAMDGYAVRSADLAEGGPAGTCDHPAADGPGVELQVRETIAAGTVGQHAVRPGSCARIMTGAPLPEGADAVVMREDATVLPGIPERVLLRGGARPGQHVRPRGEELMPGDLVLRAGTTLGPGHVGLLAHLGLDRVEVARRPLVAVVSTGDELVAPGLPLGPGQIHASNGQALCAWIEAAGARALDCGVAPDTLEGTRAAFRRALDAGCDLLLSSGGVSVGDFDFVKEALGGVGAAMDFWKVAVKPGKPLAFGTIGGVPAFGLPGNPVSCQVEFLLFVRPLLRRSMGDPRPFLPVLDATFVEGFRKSAGRAELVRVRLSFDDGGRLVARSTGDQGSSMGSSMAHAHGFALIARDSRGVPPGATVPVQVFDWSFAAGAQAGLRWAGDA